MDCDQQLLMYLPTQINYAPHILENCSSQKARQGSIFFSVVFTAIWLILFSVYNEIKEMIESYPHKVQWTQALTVVEMYNYYPELLVIH